MSSRSTKRPFFPILILFASLASLMGVVLVQSGAFAQPANSTTAQAPQAPDTADAYTYFSPRSGTPQSGGTVNVNQKFVLDMKVHPGSNQYLRLSKHI